MATISSLAVKLILDTEQFVQGVMQASGQVTHLSGIASSAANQVRVFATGLTNAATSGNDMAKAVEAIAVQQASTAAATVTFTT
jgi:hypothetical protein